MVKLANDWEVELHSLLDGGVGLVRVLLAVDVLTSAQRQTSVGNLVQKSHLLAARGHVGHYDLTLVRMVYQKVLHFIFAALVNERLVTMGNHDVILELAFSLFDLLFEYDKVASSGDVDSSLTITLELMILSSVLTLKRNFKHSKYEWKRCHTQASEVGSQERCFLAIN